MSRLFRCLVIVACALVIEIMTPYRASAMAPQDDRPAAAEEEKGGEEKTDEKGPKPYGEIITEKMISAEGLFRVHRDGDEVYFEIPASELGHDMLWVTQIAETQAGFSWAGMPVGDRVVRWERRGDKILLRDVNYDIRAEVDDPIRVAVEATSVAPIIHIVEIKTYGEGEAPVIEVSSFFTSDVQEFSARESLDAEALDDKRTLMGEVKTFPENIETRVLATYKLKKPEDDNGGGRPQSPTTIRRDPSQSGVTVVLHHSMVRLPDNPMKPRRWDERVGSWLHSERCAAAPANGMPIA